MQHLLNDLVRNGGDISTSQSAVRYMDGVADGSGNDLGVNVGVVQEHVMNGFDQFNAGLANVVQTAQERADVSSACAGSQQRLVGGEHQRAVGGNALGDKAGIVRYGSCMLPMDETLALCAVDLGGRPYFVYDASFAGQSCGGMDVQMAREFFYAVSYSAMMNLHLKVLYGENDHHKLEAMYKAFAKALSAAARHDDRIVGVLSTKGSI